MPRRPVLRFKKIGIDKGKADRVSRNPAERRRVKRLPKIPSRLDALRRALRREQKQRFPPAVKAQIQAQIVSLNKKLSRTIAVEKAREEQSAGARQKANKKREQKRQKRLTRKEELARAAQLLRERQRLKKLDKRKQRN